MIVNRDGLWWAVFPDTCIDFANNLFLHSSQDPKLRSCLHSFIHFMASTTERVNQGMVISYRQCTRFLGVSTYLSHGFANCPVNKCVRELFRCCHWSDFE